MRIHILAFGIAKDIIGGPTLELEVDPGARISDIRAQLLARFPDFKKLASLSLAVNSEYVPDDRALQHGDEVVLIPPVSGG